MAFGLPPKYIEDLPLENVSEKEFLIIAVESAKALGWKIIEANELGFTAYTHYEWSSKNERVEVSMANRTPRLISRSTGVKLLDGGRNKKNISDLIAKVSELKNSFAHMDLIIRYNELKDNPVVHLRPRFDNVLSIFIPVKGYYITPILIDINVFVYLLMVVLGVNFFMPGTEDMLKWGANFRPYIFERQWWRLFTCCFLHIGILHLFMNMVALFYIGWLLEPHLGKARFLAAYIITGLASSMASVYWHELTVSAGASGAIFGMYGVFLAMLTTNLIEKNERNALLKSILIFVGYNLMYGMHGGVDNAAHIGGLLSGIVIGYAFIPGLKMADSTLAKWAGVLVSMLMVAGFCASVLAIKPMSNDVGKYSTEIKQVGPLEDTALEVVRSPVKINKEKRLANLRDKGIKNWDAIITLLTNLDTLKLPPALHERNKLLLEYCNLRVGSYELHYKAIEQNTSEYDDSLKWYRRKIEALIDSLNQK